MDNRFYRDMISLLIEAGPGGMRVCHLSRRIFNLHTSFFDQTLDYATLRHNLSDYLWHACRSRRTIFQHPARGIYALKPHVAVQLDFDFAEEMLTPDDAIESPKNKEPRQLYLF